MSKKLDLKTICDDSGIEWTKELTKEYYVDKGYSLPDFQKEFGMNYFRTDWLLNFFKIKKRNIEEANSSKNRSDKFKTTCLERYGVENVSQLDKVKKKKSDTFLEHYGVDNIWKSKEYYDWLYAYMIKKYGKKSVPNLHGTHHPHKNLTEIQKKELYDKLHKGYKTYWENLDDDTKTEIIIKRTKSQIKNLDSKLFKSKLETRVSTALTKLQIEHTRQFFITQKSFDFRINGTTVIIEVNGDFWHGNPLIYKENDILNHPPTPIKAKDIWERDLKKKVIAEKYGYSVHYIWESDIKNLTDDELISYIYSLLSN